MPSALPLTTFISPESARKRSFKTKRAEFGNGYAQSAPDGINNVKDVWNITYELLTDTNRGTLTSVLNTVQTWDYLTWTAPGDSTSKRWLMTSDGYTEKTSGVYWTVSFTLEQTY
jgi:phage-related protein